MCGGTAQQLLRYIHLLLPQTEFAAKALAFEQAKLRSSLPERRVGVRDAALSVLDAVAACGGEALPA